MIEKIKAIIEEGNAEFFLQTNNGDVPEMTDTEEAVYNVIFTGVAIDIITLIKNK